MCSSVIISFLILLFRSASFRHSSAHSSASNMHSSTVGNSISAHPLLPLADSNLSGRYPRGSPRRDTRDRSGFVRSGSLQTVGFAGLDGRSCGGPGFSDDEVSLSPPRHSYVLELGPRRSAYHAACSDDDLAITSSDDAIGLAGNFCDYESPAYALRGPEAALCQLSGRRPRSSSQGRYRYHHHAHSHHYCPDAL
jgi:hypothetical protein